MRARQPHFDRRGSYDRRGYDQDRRSSGYDRRGDYYSRREPDYSRSSRSHDSYQGSGRKGSDYNDYYGADFDRRGRGENVKDRKESGYDPPQQNEPKKFSKSDKEWEETDGDHIKYPSKSYRSQYDKMEEVHGGKENVSRPIKKSSTTQNEDKHLDKTESLVRINSKDQGKSSFQAQKEVVGGHNAVEKTGGLLHIPEHNFYQKSYGSGGPIDRGGRREYERHNSDQSDRWANLDDRRYSGPPSSYGGFDGSDWRGFPGSRPSYDRRGSVPARSYHDYQRSFSENSWGQYSSGYGRGPSGQLDMEIWSKPLPSNERIERYV